MKKRIHLKKKKRFGFFWIIIIIILLVISIASSKIKKTSQDYANHEIKKIVSSIITATIKENSVKENIFELEKENDKISSINIDTEKENNIFDFEKQLDNIFNMQKKLFEDMNSFFENIKTQKINQITTQSEEDIEKEEENQNSLYYYEYKYNSNGINEEKDENTIYQDENTIVKYINF